MNRTDPVLVFFVKSYCYDYDEWFDISRLVEISSPTNSLLEKLEAACSSSTMDDELEQLLKDYETCKKDSATCETYGIKRVDNIMHGFSGDVYQLQARIYVRYYEYEGYDDDYDEEDDEDEL